MYLQIKKVKQTEKSRGKETTITHIGLHKDDGSFIKRVAHNDMILDKLKINKIEITIPELEGMVKDHEIEKIAPKANLFDNIPLSFKKE